MSNPSVIAQLEYAPETAFAESSSTFSTLAVPTTAPIDPSGLRWDKEPANRPSGYMHGTSGYVLMGQGGTFTTEFDLAGHGSTMVGSPSITAMENLIGFIFGNRALSATASTTLTGGTATVPTTTASGTFSAGAITPIGALGDGDGDGQFYAIGTHTTTNLTLLTDLNGAPVNGAVLYPATNFYFHETATNYGGTGLTGSAGHATTNCPSLRFRFLNRNQQYTCHGVVPTAFTLSGLNAGQRPKMSVTWEVARWSAVDASTTVPSGTTQPTDNPSMVGAGSLNVAAVGTTTRSLRNYRDLQINVTLGMYVAKGPTNTVGASAYQSNVACHRMPTMVEWTWVEDAAASSATPTLQGWGTSTTKRHALLTLSTTDGSRVGFYSPNCCVKAVPVQENFNGINSMRVTLVAETGATTTNDLTLSHFRMAYA